ncbi:MAG: hypothetical protein Q9201_003071 [Fulgogasparrea decipioides]
MGAERFDEDIDLLPVSPQLEPVWPKIEPPWNDKWEPLIFEGHAPDGDGDCIKTDPSLQILYSFPELDGERSDSDEQTTHRHQSFPRKGQRKVLPVIIHNSTIMSRADSGSEDNVMAAELALSLNVNIDRDLKHWKMFRLANGNIVEAIGRVVIDVAFAREPDTTIPHCSFYVFEILITPFIIGMSFLDLTETLVKYKYRLQVIDPLDPGPLQLCSLDTPRCRLLCQANMQSKLACADTGSEVDLVSLPYVKQRGFIMTAVDLEDSMIQFADGSTGHLAGKVDITIVLGIRKDASFVTTFYVLENLSCDILFGEDFLDRTNAFDTYREAFSLIDEDCGASEVNTIAWFNPAEWRLLRLVRDQTATETEAENHVHGWFRGRLTGLCDKVLRNDRTKSTGSGVKLESYGFHRTEDARELHRQEMAQKYIDTLKGNEREQAILKEDLRVDLYERKRKQRWKCISDVGQEEAEVAEGGRQERSSEAGRNGGSSTEFQSLETASLLYPLAASSQNLPVTQSPSPQIDIDMHDSTSKPNSHHEFPFKCQFRGCAASFQSQYHLDSHYNAHDLRPYYCSVPTCPRATGGKGFKRKNEMLRHRLCHKSPGYICPFCVEEHKYPRPDNLQRHVLAWHDVKIMQDDINPDRRFTFLDTLDRDSVKKDLKYDTALYAWLNLEKLTGNAHNKIYWKLDCAADTQFAT